MNYAKGVLVMALVFQMGCSSLVDELVMQLDPEYEEGPTFTALYEGWVPRENVMLLFSFDRSGSDDSSDFENDFDVRGNLAVTTDAKFGTGSMYFPDAGGHMKNHFHTDDFAFGLGAYGIDFWVKTTDQDSVNLNTRHPCNSAEFSFS